MRVRVAAAFAALVFVSPVFMSSVAAAEFASDYSVEGKRADGKAYTGTVSISKTSETTYEVEWDIAGQKFSGTGIGSTDGLAVAYKSGDDTGIAIYREVKGGEIEGFWTYAGGKQVFQENWSPK